MLNNKKTIFITLCIIMFFINGYLYLGKDVISIEGLIGGGIGGSIISIPLWSCIGILLSYIYLFFYHIVKPEEKDPFSILQKASLGLIVGILLKPIFGILW